MDIGQDKPASVVCGGDSSLKIVITKISKGKESYLTFEVV